MPLVFLTIASGVLYLCSAAVSAYQLKHKTGRFSAGAKVCFFAALLTQSITIGITSASTQGTLLQGPNVLMLASWTLAVAFTFFEIIVNKPYGYGAFVVPVVALMMIVAELMNAFVDGAVLYNRVFHDWPLLVVHITCFFIAIACFVISAVASGMLLYQHHLAKAKSTKFLTVRMPALSALKKIAGRTVCVGLPFFTAGMLLGFTRYLVLWGTMVGMGCEGSLWYLGPRITLSIAVFATYCLYLAYTYLTPGRLSSRTMPWLSIVAAIASIGLATLSSTAVM